MARDCCRNGALFIIYYSHVLELDSEYNTQPPVPASVWVTAFPARTWSELSGLEVFTGRSGSWVPKLQRIPCPTPSGFSDTSQPCVAIPCWDAAVPCWDAAVPAPILPCSLRAVCTVLFPTPPQQDGRAAGGVGCQQPVPLSAAQHRGSPWPIPTHLAGGSRGVLLAHGTGSEQLPSALCSPPARSPAARRCLLVSVFSGWECTIHEVLNCIASHR